jgi:hypothetical protein
VVKSHTITGGGGAQRHLVEAGNPQGRPILFLHGTSQCGLTLSRQLRSDLADTYRLVAMDLRGHGRSERPPADYADSKLWTDDVDAAIRELGLDRPAVRGLNTLFVDKRWVNHGLLQAYSRTNRILNSVKTYGNIVSFRDLEKRDERRHRALRQQGRAAWCC